jgi:hypothetical protein
MLGWIGRAGLSVSCDDCRRERRVLGGSPRSEAASATESRPEAKTTRAATTACAAAAPPTTACAADDTDTDYGRLHSAPTRCERDAGATGSSGYEANEARPSVF